MTKKTFTFWGLDFICTTAIAVILAFGKKYMWFIIFPFSVVFVLKFLQFFLHKDEKYRAIQNQMSLLLLLIKKSYGNIRCTLHVPRWRFLRRKLIQTFDYIQMGGAGGGGKGRSFPTDKGIIGRAYNRKMPQVESFHDSKEYYSKMVGEYNYTKSQTEKRTQDRRSYLCYPVMNEKNIVLGLLYFDSNMSEAFSLNDNDEIIGLLHSGMNAIKTNLI